MNATGTDRDIPLPCVDPDCVDRDGNRSIAEPEMDGDVRYHECLECGHAFNYRRVRAAQPADTCAVGIPEAVRRRASVEPAPLLQIGRPPRHAATS